MSDTFYWIGFGWIALALFGRFCLYELGYIINPKSKEYDNKHGYD